MPKEPGKRTDLKQPGSSGVTRLQEMGITKKESHQAQVLGDMMSLSVIHGSGVTTDYRFTKTLHPNIAYAA